MTMKEDVAFEILVPLYIVWGALGILFQSPAWLLGTIFTAWVLVFFG